MDTNLIGKILILSGILILVFGFTIIMLGKINIGIGKLPGDIFIKKGNFSFYFPFVSSLMISIVLSIIFNLFSKK